MPWLRIFLIFVKDLGNLGLGKKFGYYFQFLTDIWERFYRV